MYPNPHHSSSAARNGRRIFCFFSVLLWLAFSNIPALAHKVTIFAWVEGDTVYTQSKFSGGRKARNSTVVVYDKEGKLLLEGKTDKNGLFSFKIPKKTELKVALKASMGHLAEWTIPAEEIMGAADNSEAGVVPSTQQAAPSTETKTSSELPATTAVSLSLQDVQDLIDRSLDRKLSPIVNMLADSLDRGPGMSEVMGGIGYIFGLVGVALYFATRGKRK
ncbi:MAG: hypothetical protein HWN68_01305 [Desulfobacterales bacterium]|nr:hypothetical protein [Desulfobacterales bacterium]